MPTEIEELRLVISMTDVNVEATTARIKQNFDMIGGGGANANVDRFNRHHDKMTEMIKATSELFAGGEKAMVGFVGRMGAAGAAVAGFSVILTAGINNLNRYSQTIVSTNNKAASIGVHGAVLQTWERAFDRAGL